MQILKPHLSKEAGINAKALNKFLVPHSILIVTKVLNKKKEDLTVTIKDRLKFLKIID